MFGLYFKTIILTSLTLLVTCRNITVHYSKQHTISYVDRPVNFFEAEELCKTQGLYLALPIDLEIAYKHGLHNCKYGWLATMRAAYSQREKGPRKCKTKHKGIIYKYHPHSNDVIPGAYCTTRKHFQTGKFNKHNEKVFNLWIRYDLSGVYNLREDLKRNFNKNIVRNVRAIYPCCNIYKLQAVDGPKNTQVTDVVPRVDDERMREVQYLMNRYFPESKPKYIPHVHISYQAMITLKAGSSNRSSTIDDLVQKTLSAGWDGVMIDYEPKINYTIQHARLTADFLDALASKMHSYGKEVDFCISDWGILKYYGVYNKTKVDYFATMGMTYFGKNVQKNIKNVERLKKKVNLDRVQIGIKSKMYELPNMAGDKHETHPFKKPSEWRYKKLHYFVKWLKKKSGIKQVHIWPESFGYRSRTELYFYELLSNMA